jgi:hypothetical protein
MSLSANSSAFGLLSSSYEDYNEATINENLLKLQIEQPEVGFTQSGLYSNIYSGLPAENTADANLFLGITKGITYPLWVYLAGGISLYRPLYEVRVMGNDNQSESLGRYTLPAEEDKAITEGKIIPQLEGGLILRLSKVFVSGGARADYNFKNIYWKVGLGITFNR